MKQLFKQPVLYLALLGIGSKARCVSTREVRNARQLPTPNPQSQTRSTTDGNYMTQPVQQVGPNC
ncbi:hypothetical protein [Nostoc favosum]|uniref:Secreted protein n=1 Tax=Nostoc favosum CHAB5714 TaxID=2780399 RepID=A0ABS8I0P8_9NOSO|nr:hypothetical protein [Nostoc favosum]MCC5597843.1 hypothetical protein [Nostoc favosum CHAB5714]